MSGTSSDLRKTWDTEGQVNNTLIKYAFVGFWDETDELKSKLDDQDRWIESSVYATIAETCSKDRGKVSV